MPEASGEPTYSVIRAINERLLLAGLREQEAALELEALLEAAPNAVVIVNGQGHITRVNAQAERLFGCARDAMIGAEIETLLPERLRERHREHRLVYMAAPATRAMGSGLDLCARRADGSEVPVEIGLSTSMTAEGLQVICSIRDISERRLLERSLQEQTRRIHLLQAAAVAANESVRLEEALPLCLAEICACTGWPVGHCWLPEDDAEDRLESSGIWHLAHPERFAEFRRMTEAMRPGLGQILPGRVLETGEPFRISDLSTNPEFVRAPAARQADLRTGIAFPIRTGETTAGVLEFFDGGGAEPDGALLDVMAQIGIQLGRVVERQRARARARRAREELEARVRERTMELARANAELRREMAERQRGEEARAALRRQLVIIQEEERRRFARDLHDQTGQSLTVLLLGLKSLEESVAHSPQAMEQVRELQALVGRMGQELHQISHALHPPSLDTLGLPRSMADLVAAWSQRTGIRTDLHCHGLETSRMPKTIETILYRAAQEALNNVLRHARARRASVILERRRGQATLIVEDDGKGFDTEAAARDALANGRLGLRGMQGRVAEAGGTLTIESVPGDGTRLRVAIPLTDEGNTDE